MTVTLNPKFCETSTASRAQQTVAATRIMIPNKNGKKSQITAFSQHEKTCFNIQELKSRFNTRRYRSPTCFSTEPQTQVQHKPATQKSQQHKHNLANPRSLKRALLQAETLKTSEKQPFTQSDSKKNSKRISKVLPSANIRNQIATFKN
jgi:hypothetical protein